MFTGYYIKANQKKSFLLLEKLRESLEKTEVFITIAIYFSAKTSNHV